MNKLAFELEGIEPNPKAPPQSHPQDMGLIDLVNCVKHWIRRGAPPHHALNAFTPVGPEGEKSSAHAPHTARPQTKCDPHLIEQMMVNLLDPPPPTPQ